MIFFVDNNGSIIKSVPSPVYQGSANTNNVYLVAPFASNMSVTLAFRLPNNVWTQVYVMTPQRELQGIVNEATGQTYSGWVYSMPNEITEYYGTVTVQFFFYAPTGSGDVTAIPTTSAASFEVMRGVPAQLPPTPSQDIYEEILKNIAILQSDLTGGYYAARAIYAWNDAYTYGASEITYHFIGEFGAFVMSRVDNNTQPPYLSDGTVNDAYWEEVVNFNNISEDYFNQIKDLVEQAQSARDEAEQIVEQGKADINRIVDQGKADINSIISDGVTEITNIVNEADNTFNQYLDRAEQAAEDAEESASNIAQYIENTIRFVPELPDRGEEGILYAVVSDDDSNLFAIWIWDDAEGWQSMGEANLVMNTCKLYRATLYTENWSQNRQTIFIDKLTTSDDVDATPYPGYAAAYINYGIMAIEIVDGGVVFSCTSVPPNAIVVYLLGRTKQEVPIANGYYTRPQTDELLALKQNVTDDALETTAKTIPAAINEVNTAVDGLRQEIVDSAHFKGMAATPEAVRAIPADLNDYCYCISTGTIWTYEESGWTDSGDPYPSDAIPKSTTVPLMNGTAAIGNTNTYADGAHVHPTDTSRASVAALTTEASNRQQADSQLNALITAETAAREQAVANVQTSLAEETTARQQADTTLQGNIDSEATARQQADTTLQNNIDAEISTRQAADSALGTRIDNLQNGTVPIAKATAADTASEATHAVSADTATTAATANTATTATTAQKVANALTFGSKTFDGSAPQQITAADLGLSTVFYPAGSYTFETLPAPSASTLGAVYDVTNAFVTDSRFVEGAGKAYPAGTNIAVNKVGDAYLFDVQGAFFDTSQFAQVNGSYPNMSVGNASNATNAATATNATNATNDGQGRNIAATYATKEEVSGAGQANYVEADVSVPVERWSANSVTLTASDSAAIGNISPTGTIVMYPAAESAIAVLTGRVKISAYAAGSVTLSCATVPTAALSLSFSIQY